MGGVTSVRTGTDLTSVAEVETTIARFGDRYLHRVFTDHELASAQGTPHVVASSLAARFAAKEATMKVLRPSGLSDQAVDWRSIEVRRHESGWCSLHLTGTAQALADAAGVRDISVSLSHEGEMATAVVVALCGPVGSEPVGDATASRGNEIGELGDG
jgi:holo-[acyl-carrier protein] synthase